MAWYCLISVYIFQPLAISDRVLVGEGVLTKMCRKKPKPRQFFLFNDILIYGNIVISKKKVCWCWVGLVGKLISLYIELWSYESVILPLVGITVRFISSRWVVWENEQFIGQSDAVLMKFHGIKSAIRGPISNDDILNTLSIYINICLGWIKIIFFRQFLTPRGRNTWVITPNLAFSSLTFTEIFLLTHFLCCRYLNFFHKNIAGTTMMKGKQFFTVLKFSLQA